MELNHSTEQPGDNQENQGLKGVNLKMKIVEGDNGALNLALDSSDMGEYVDQVGYYTITLLTRLAVISETYNLNTEYNFALLFDSRTSDEILSLSINWGD